MILKNFSEDIMFKSMRIIKKIIYFARWYNFICKSDIGKHGGDILCILIQNQKRQ